MTDAAAAEAFHAAACGLLVLEPKGKIELANARIAEWSGISASALVDRPFQDLFVVGSKLFLQTQWWPLLQMQESVAEVQLELVSASGATVPVLVNAARREDQRIHVAVMVAKDRRKYERELLLARRRAEELLATVQLREAQFRTLAENSPDVIARFDTSRQLSYVSQTPCSVREIANLGAHLASALDDALAGNAVSFAFEESVDDALVHYEARCVPERDGANAIVSVLVAVRDVTALREAERAARQRAMFAEQLIGIVSHDLRNPLNAILLGTHLLATTEGAQRVATTRRVANAAQRATRLTAELLDFTQARLGTGLRMLRSEIDLHAVVAETIEELRLAAPEREVIHERIGAGTGLADADRLAQVVTNLVSNAFAYGTKGTPVHVASVIEPATMAIRVTNQGRPLVPELREAIFEPLQRGEEQVQRGSRSVGLGLYIVRQIALAHGGEARVAVSDENGTTFEVVVGR